MYDFSDFTNLIVFLALAGIIYILFKWLMERRKERQDDQEDGQNETM